MKRGGALFGRILEKTTNPKGPCSPKVVIWKPLWALSIYFIATWTLWEIEQGNGRWVCKGFIGLAVTNRMRTKPQTV